MHATCSFCGATCGDSARYCPSCGRPVVASAAAADEVTFEPSGAAAEDSSTRSWDAVADDWVAHADANDYRLYYLMPRLLAFIGDVAGKTVLDLGCGEGGYARQMSRRGGSVVGVDGSARLIEVAEHRSRADGVDVRYVCTNANALDALDAQSFDLVVAAMSLMDVEDYEGAIGEVHRVLRAGGELVMSIMHPCFSAPVSSWVRDEAGALKFFAVDRYFDRVAWDEMITPAFRAPVVRRHRPLEQYMASLLDRGFVLRAFHEPSATDEEIRLSRRFRKLARIPYFLFMRWMRP